MKRTLREYLVLRRKGKGMPREAKKPLTNKQRRYIVDELGKDRPASVVGPEVNVTSRHARRVRDEFFATGGQPSRRPVGRPLSSPPSQEKVNAVLDSYDAEPVGVLRTAYRLRGSIDIRYWEVYQIMKDHGLVEDSPAKSRKRKYVRYERKYANAMWHTDWHVMKDPRVKGANLVSFLDDSSRGLMGSGLFKEATSENVVAVLSGAIDRFGAPATILSDNGSCFVGQRGGKRPRGSWTPTAFEEELLRRDIGLINSRPYHPQTNGKLERFHASIEAEIGHYDSLEDYVEYYNNRRLHFSLDIKNLETPLAAWRSRQASEGVRRANPRWMEDERE